MFFEASFLVKLRRVSFSAFWVIALPLKRKWLSSFKQLSQNKVVSESFLREWRNREQYSKNSILKWIHSCEQFTWVNVKGKNRKTCKSGIFIRLLYFFRSLRKYWRKRRRTVMCFITIVENVLSFLYYGIFGRWKHIF